MANYILLIKILFLSILVVNCELSENAKNTALGTNLQGYNVYKKIAEKDGNIVYSPISTQTILALAYLGAQENTAKQMSEVLHLSPDQKLAASSFAEILPIFSKHEENFTLELVNKMYPSISVNLNEEFLKEAAKFNSSVDKLDFSKNDEAAQRINDFVKEKTRGKIKNVVNEDNFNSDTRLVLLNTIYFKTKWNEKFESFGSKFDFYLKNGQIKPSNFMQREGTFGYKEIPELNSKILEINYLDPNYAMYIILPDEVDGLKLVENQIEKLENHTKEKLKKHYVSVQLPIFKIEYKTELKPILESIGMKDAFSHKANFTGLLKDNEPLEISDIFQKAFIDVDQDGTEAAAVTVVEFVPLNGLVVIEQKYFLADRPFLYYIQEKTSKAILFLGRFEEPA